MVTHTSSRGVLRQWHWLAVLAILVLAMIPSAGLWIAGTSALLGAGLALVGGIAPFLRILFTDPGTVGLMLASRSARFEMMNQPDTHPYKQLVRGAFTPTRGMFWRGVLLMVTFIPAAFLNANVGRLFQGDSPVAARPAGPPGLPPGPPGLVVDPLQLPNREQPGQPPPAGGPGQPPFQRPAPPPGFAGPLGANRGQPSAAANGPTFVVTITYSESERESVPAGQVVKTIGGVPGVQVDTIVVDEPSRQITFELKGPPNMGLLAPPLGKLGLKNINMTAKTKPRQ